MNEETLFAEALAIESQEERCQFLDAACGDNPELRKAVENLLHLAANAGSFLEHSPVEAAADALKEIEPTIVYSDGSTYDDEREANSSGRFDWRLNPQDPDDEISLDFLKPATREDSLGCLGHYEILEVVGRGAFGTVLRAFDERLQRVVAVKVLAPEMAATSPARKRFLREARTSAKIRHENVVSIYAVEDDPIPYLVMEYIPGKTLQQRLDEQGPLDLPDVLRLGKQIADGLAAAHAEGLIHRDVKPANILLDGGMDERVRITDFGLARTADDASMTQSGLIAGTPMYMAPEQAQGVKLDQRADLFSFGSVLYQMLSGRPPFRAPNTMAVLKRVTEDMPRPLQQIIPETPEWICELIGYLHAKDPAKRYGSAREVSELLAECAKELEAGRVPQIPDPSTTGENAEKPATFRSSRKDSLVQKPLFKVAAAVVLLLGLLGITEATGVTKLASTVIRLTTGSGTLVIETDDPSVKITINGAEVTIRGAGIEELTLRPGAYQVTALRDGQPVKQELASITRNGRTVVRMTLEPDGKIPKSVASNEAKSATTRSLLKKTLFGFPGRVLAVTYSPDGQLLATAGDRAVRVWDAKSGELLFALTVSEEEKFTALTFSPDSRFLLTGPDRGTPDCPISIWEAKSGKPAGTLVGHEKGLCDIAFSNDGTTLISAGYDPSVRLWDFSSRKMLRKIPTPGGSWTRSARFSKTGMIALGSNNTVYLIDTAGKLHKTLESTSGPLCFSPDGKRLTGTTWRDGLVTICDVETGQKIASWRAHQGNANEVAFSPDGNVLVTAGGDGKVRFWDVSQQRELVHLSHDKEAYAIAFSPDGQTLASTGYDQVVKLWDVSELLSQSRQPERSAESPPVEQPSAESPSVGPELIVALQEHRNFVSPIVFSPDGRLLASTGPGDVCVWDVEAQKLRWKLPDPVKGVCMGVVFSPDGKYLLTAPEDRNSEAPISIWEAETGQPVGVLEGHKRGLYELSFSPDGKTLLSGGWEGFARLWDFEKRSKIRDIPSPSNHWLRSATFSSQGKIAIGQDKVYVYDQSGDLLKTLDRYAGPFCFSRDGRFLAGTTWKEGRVTIWDIDTGEEFASWRAHTGRANGVAFSTDGKALATAGSDRCVRLWDIESRRELAELGHDGEVCGVAFSPDGVTLATSGFDKLVKLWDVSQVLTPVAETDTR